MPVWLKENDTKLATGFKPFPLISWYVAIVANQNFDSAHTIHAVLNSSSHSSLL
jgi:hypothetical protein